PGWMCLPTKSCRQQVLRSTPTPGMARTICRCARVPTWHQPPAPAKCGTTGLDRSERMASESKDIVIVGGSIVGCATAYYLAQSGAIANRRITVVEKDLTYATCSTARSAGGVRQQFSTPENIAMSKVTLDLIRN